MARHGHLISGRSPQMEPPTYAEATSSYCRVPSEYPAHFVRFILYSSLHAKSERLCKEYHSLPGTSGGGGQANDHDVISVTQHGTSHYVLVIRATRVRVKNDRAGVTAYVPTKAPIHDPKRTSDKVRYQFTPFLEMQAVLV
ncbi:hypothetical protein DFH06DRAFT_1130107 [Mycena polygramma]|nr:hypothetical protein DFH06DRAFT_1130107 [Mycena polygramma]